MTPADAPRRFLALGDSYTIGEAVAPHERWPELLARRLRECHLAVGDPRIVARTGWTTDELANAFAAAPLDAPYDFVTLLIGVNDQYRGRSVHSYAAAFPPLLHRAVGVAGGAASRVVVIAIPDWGVTPFAASRDRARIAREIDAFNATNRGAAAAAGARYVDISAVSREAANDPRLTAPDGLHPSAELDRRWTDAILPVALDALTVRGAAAETPAPRRP
jgi:lysophospholipase L1-like esterase